MPSLERRSQRRHFAVGVGPMPARRAVRLGKAESPLPRSQGVRPDVQQGRGFGRLEIAHRRRTPFSAHPGSWVIGRRPLDLKGHPVKMSNFSPIAHVAESSRGRAMSGGLSDRDFRNGQEDERPYASL